MSSPDGYTNEGKFMPVNRMRKRGSTWGEHIYEYVEEYTHKRMHTLPAHNSTLTEYGKTNFKHPLSV